MRSDGDIRFVVLTPATQIVACLSGIALLGWFAFATVNVAFKDQIIALKEQRIAEVKHAYEARISEIRSSVDLVNSRLLLDQDSYLAKVDLLRVDYEKLIERHKRLETLVQQGSFDLTTEDPVEEPALEAEPEAPEDLSEEQDAGQEPAQDQDQAVDQPTEPARDETAAGEPLASGKADSAKASDAPPAVTEGKPNTAASPATSNDAASPEAAAPDSTATAKQRHGHITPREKPAVILASSALSDLETPSLGSLRERYSGDFVTNEGAMMPLRDAEMLARHLDRRQHRLLDEVGGKVSTRFAGLKQTTKRLGLSPERLIASAPPLAAVGGPYVPVSIQGEQDELFKRINKIEDQRDDTLALRRQLGKLPLAMPLRTAKVNSGFGSRRDPFRRSRAQHTGIDLKAGFGAPVTATADGVVVEAQWSSGYGKLVVIDHDNGVSTRYAHLSVISVKQGQRVRKGSVVGRLGNTGRSTGAHLHYETRVSGRAIDPNRFWQARNDLQKQEQAGNRP